MSKLSAKKLAAHNVAMLAFAERDLEIYEARVQAYEDQGMTRSDAQGVVEAEDMLA